MDHHNWDNWPEDDHYDGEPGGSDYDGTTGTDDHGGDFDLADPDDTSLDPTGGDDLTPTDAAALDHGDGTSLDDRFDGDITPPPDEPLDGDPAAPDPGDDPWTVDGDDTTSPSDHLIGHDPHVDHTGDDPAWAGSPFPEPLNLDTTPEPVDGFPWSDPALLGEPPTAPDPAWSDVQSTGSATDLAAYAGTDLSGEPDPWTALIASDDPATSTLARWWAPGS